MKERKREKVKETQIDKMIHRYIEREREIGSEGKKEREREGQWKI